MKIFDGGGRFRQGESFSCAFVGPLNRAAKLLAIKLIERPAIDVRKRLFQQRDRLSLPFCKRTSASRISDVSRPTLRRQRSCSRNKPCPISLRIKRRAARAFFKCLRTSWTGVSLDFFSPAATAIAASICLRQIRRRLSPSV